MGTLLEAIGIVLETYFGFGFPNRSCIGDSLNKAIVDLPAGSLYMLMFRLAVSDIATSLNRQPS